MMPRPPAQPRRAEIPDHEVAMYDAIIELVSDDAIRRNIDALDDGSSETRSDGDDPYAGPCFGPLLNSPPVVAAVDSLRRTVVGLATDAEGYSDGDREWIDLVLGYELNSTMLLTNHIP